MPNNFKLGGNFYVSKFGNDSWSGTSPDAPKRTVQAAVTLMANSGPGLTLVIGAGVYRETIVYSPAGGWTNTIIGDGKVVLEGNFTNTVSNAGNAGGLNFVNLEFRNYLYIISGGVGFTFSNCLVKSDVLVGNSGANIHTNSTFINCTIGVSSGTVNFRRCLFINCNAGYAGSKYPSYTSVISEITNSVIQYGIVRMAASPTINFNNFLSSSIMIIQATAVTSGVYQDYYGNYYDLSITTSTGTGTVSDPYGRPITNGRAFGLTNHRILYPTLNVSSSAFDPKFNSVENYDFSLASDSQLLNRASDGANIGPTLYAVRNPAASSAFSGSSATVDAGLTFRYTNYVISGSAVTGSVTSAPILVNNLDKKVLQKVTYNGLLAFNKDTTAPSGSNVNVPDVETFTSASGNAGANPDRLVYYMRFTSGSTMPTTDAQWENAGLWTAGTYNVFEWNTKPSIDLSGRGNGSSSFNPADAQTYIQAQWIQLQIKLRNDYLL